MNILELSPAFTRPPDAGVALNPDPVVPAEGGGDQRLDTPLTSAPGNTLPSRGRYLS